MTSEDNQQGQRGSGRIDRRAFLEGTAWLAAAAGFSGIGWDSACAAQRRSTAALLPDGSEFPLWEQPLTFTKTYYVDNGSPAADDGGPGDRERPFRTIDRAAEILQPGQRVIIAGGIYRECVRPARGGTDPSQMISYEAAPGAKVCIRGSEVLKNGWVQAPVPPRPSGPHNAAASDVTIWRHELSAALFPDAYNPFALPSIMGSWEWLDPAKVDMGPYLRRRGLVFVDGEPLEPMEQLFELAMPNLPPEPDFTRTPVPQNGLPGGGAAARSCRKSEVRRPRASGRIIPAPRSTCACPPERRKITWWKSPPASTPSSPLTAASALFG